MSGRHEREIIVEGRIQEKLKNLPEIFTEYYYSMIGSGKSYNTAYNYINYMAAFMEYTFKGKYEEDFYLNVKPIHINKYITSLRTKKANGKNERTSDSFRSTTWSALNAFFQFLVPDYIDTNPVASTTRPKMKDNPSVTYLTKEEIKGILDNVEANASMMFKNRELCLLKLGFSTGLRVSAIVQIDIGDIDFKHNRIRVIEKGDYDNYVMFGDNLKAQLKLWIEDRKKYFDKGNTDALFLTQYGLRMSPEAVSEVIKKYANGVTDKKITPHVMRHSCATNLYEATGDIYLCAKQLNHKNVTTTQRYAEISSTRQREAADELDKLI